MKNINPGTSVPFIGSLDITNQCNLKCLHCFNKSNELDRNELTDEEVIRLVTDIADFHFFSFCFCGGETLLRYDLLVKCIEILKSNGTENINMVTNGILLTDEKAKALKMAGVASIQVSIDGSCPRTHNKMRQSRDAFNGAINAIDILEINEISFGVAFCPTNFNAHELPELAKMLNRYCQITSLRVQPLMVMGRATNASIEPTVTQYREIVQCINLFNAEKRVHFKLEWGDPIDHLIRFDKYVDDISLLNIQSNGDLTVSPYLPITIGNVKKHRLFEYFNAGFSAVWKSKIVRDYTTSVRNVKDLGKPHLGKTVFEDQPVYYDLIDNKEEFIYD